MLVCGYAFYEDKNHSDLHYLKLSASKQGIPLELVGIGNRWLGWVATKVYELPKFLKKCNADILMVIDADTLLVQGISFFESEFKNFGADLVISAEMNCFPFGELATEYPECNSPFRYLNGGCFIGRKEAILHMLDACRKIFETEQPPYGKDWRGDQGIMTYTFLRGVVPTVLDHECRIFQTMCSLPKDSFTIENGRFRNVKTQTTPGVLHFAGHTGGASNFYKMLYD